MRSLIESNSMPGVVKALISGYRPDPTPLTTTCASLIPAVTAFSARTSPTFDAANGVPFFASLNPRLPLDDQNKTLPFISLTTALVLLNVASIESNAVVTFFLGWC